MKGILTLAALLALALVAQPVPAVRRTTRDDAGRLVTLH
jgi:hypothetical protein